MSPTIQLNMTEAGHDERYREARRKGVRRTVWIAGGIAVAIFLLSILQMLKIQ